MRIFYWKKRANFILKKDWNEVHAVSHKIRSSISIFEFNELMVDTIFISIFSPSGFPIAVMAGLAVVSSTALFCADVVIDSKAHGFILDSAGD